MWGIRSRDGVMGRKCRDGKCYLEQIKLGAGRTFEWAEVGAGDKGVGNLR